MDKKGVGVEDAPFMILAVVFVMLLVVWIGSGVMTGFAKGNEHQAAVTAATELYKHARLVSIGYNGSSETIRLSIPPGYSVVADGEVVAVSDAGAELIERMRISSVSIVAEPEEIPAGEHEAILTYFSKEKNVRVTWS